MVVIAAQVEEKTNTASAALTSEIITKFRPQYIFMAGISAGVTFTHKLGQPKVGDVVVADGVWIQSKGKFFGQNENGEEFALRPVVHKIDPGFRELLKKNIKKWGGNIHVHIGTYASGAAVIANEDYVRQNIIPKVQKTKAIDMESYGVIYSATNAVSPKPFPIVAKAISDFANESKSDASQNMAAFNSCEFVKYALSTLPFVEEEISMIELIADSTPLKGSLVEFPPKLIKMSLFTITLGLLAVLLNILDLVDILPMMIFLITPSCALILFGRRRLIAISGALAGVITLLLVILNHGFNLNLIIPLLLGYVLLVFVALRLTTFSKAIRKEDNLLTWRKAVKNTEMQLEQAIQNDETEKFGNFGKELDLAKSVYKAMNNSSDIVDIFHDRDGMIWITISQSKSGGIGNILFNSKTVNYIHAMACCGLDVETVLREANRLLVPGNTEHAYLNLFVGKLDTKKWKFEYINAGGSPNFFKTADKINHLYSSTDLQFGVDLDSDFKKFEVKFKPDDLLLLCSSGVTDNRTSDGESLRPWRIEKYLSEVRKEPCEVITGGLYSTILALVSPKKCDFDFSFVAIRRNV